MLAADGSEMPLRPKSFALLRLLLENAGRLLSRDTIMAALWPNLFVTDDNVTQCVRDVRRALGAEAQRMLRTQPRRGYLFTSEVVAVPAVAASPRYERVERYDSGRYEPLVAVDGREGDELLSKWRRYIQTSYLGRFDVPKKSGNVPGTEWFWPVCRQIWEWRPLRQVKRNRMMGDSGPGRPSGATNGCGL